TGTINGTITASSDAAPIRNAQIYLFDSDSRLVGSPVPPGNSATDGTYSISGIPFGTYYAWVVSPIGFSRAAFQNTLFGGQHCPGAAPHPACRVDQSTPIVLTSGSPSATANVSLDAAGKISGTATLVRDGSAIANLTIGVYAGTTQVATAVTDDLGQYTAA